MDKGTIIGFICGIGLILMAILMKASIINFIDPSSFLIVFGGTLSASMIAYPMESVFHALKNSIQLFFVQKIDMVLTIKEMLKISTLARKKGVLELESYKTKDLFLKKSLNLLSK